MKRNLGTLATFGAAVLLLAGCGNNLNTTENLGEAASADSEDNGRGLNGRGLNGRGLNGRGLNGRGLNGVSLSGVSDGSASLGDVTLNATRFSRQSADGHMFYGRAIVGAVFNGILDDGSSLALRIDGMTRDRVMGDGVYSYAVSYQVMGGWNPLCGVDSSGAPVRAVPLAGMWNYGEGVEGGGSFIDDPSVFTFACEGYALAKCVELGYQPWEETLVCTMRGCSWTSLAPYHQACTRLLRADYCGDGLSYTLDGTTINLYDNIGVQADTERWAFEAEWDEGGARCATRERISGQAVPPCWSSLQQARCGSRPDFWRGALLMSEDMLAQ